MANAGCMKVSGEQLRVTIQRLVAGSRMLAVGCLADRLKLKGCEAHEVKGGRIFAERHFSAGKFRNICG